MRLRIIGEDGRSPARRAEDLHRARDRDEARRQLAAVLELLRAAMRTIEDQLAEGERPAMSARGFDLLDDAYAALDRYLAGLLHAAAIDPACGPSCPGCCTDLPPILPIEALRMARALRARDDGSRRLDRAAEQAEAFTKLLHERDAPPDLTSAAYREAQLDWRRRGHPCPVLGDDGSCSAYAARPLSCRIHIHVEDPAHCRPDSPRFTTAERPPLWGHPREAEIELALAAIGRLLELPATPNLQAGLAQIHEPT